ncbi:MAG: O-antigen ligase family protein [Clostridia bacterium]
MSYLDSFFHSTLFLIVCLLIGAWGFIWHHELVAMSFMIVFCSLILLTSEDISPTTLPFALMTMIPIAITSNVTQDFVKLAWLAVLFVPCFILHFVLFPPKKTMKKGYFFWSMVVYSIALMIGGIGSIALKDYFKINALYYVLMLGVGMLLAYLWYNNSIPTTHKSIDYFARVMSFICLMSVIMWTSEYIKALPSMKDGFYILYRGWKNNIASMSLLTFAFPFYLATKRKFGLPYFLLGVLGFAAIVISSSRGAMIAGIICFPLIVIATIYFLPTKKRIAYCAVIALVIVTAGAFIIKELDYFIEKIEEWLAMGGRGREDLYAEAWKNFLANPIFGAGIGYDNPVLHGIWGHAMDMFWYHSTFFQIVGSMGLVGVVAYLFQMGARLRIMLRKNAFSILAFGSFLAFEGYAMINVGDFEPLPFMLLMTLMMTMCEKQMLLNQKEKIDASYDKMVAHDYQRVMDEMSAKLK